MLLVNDSTDSPSESGKRDYEVGHCKPPKNRQFGQPGGNKPNAGGMPKGTVSIKRAIRKRVASRELAERIADHAIELALARDAKVQDVLALGAFHDEGLSDDGADSAKPAEQQYTDEQQRMAVVRWLRNNGHNAQADDIQGGATDDAD